jgi:Ca-activated chloride channel family protein
VEAKAMRLEPLFAWWVVALIFAPFIIWLVWLTIRLVRKDPSVRLVGLFRAVGIVVCLALIAIGPSIPGGKAPAGMVNLDVVIVIDRTASISAEDYDGDKPRLEGVKRDVLMTIEALKGARIALVTSDTEVNVRVPFTSDSSAVSTAVRVLDQEVAYR